MILSEIKILHFLNNISNETKVDNYLEKNNYVSSLMIKNNSWISIPEFLHVINENTSRSSLSVIYCQYQNSINSIYRKLFSRWKQLPDDGSHRLIKPFLCMVLPGYFASVATARTWSKGSQGAPSKALVLKYFEPQQHQGDRDVQRSAPSPYRADCLAIFADIPKLTKFLRRKFN